MCVWGFLTSGVMLQAVWSAHLLLLRLPASHLVSSGEKPPIENSLLVRLLHLPRGKFTQVFSSMGPLNTFVSLYQGSILDTSVSPSRVVYEAVVWTNGQVHIISDARGPLLTKLTGQSAWCYSGYLLPKTRPNSLKSLQNHHLSRQILHSGPGALLW